MIYIVEGCDAVGKTTFINKFAELTGYPVLKGSSFEMAAEGVEKMFQIMWNHMNQNENIILDRSFISNLVYGPMYDKDTLSFDQSLELLQLTVEKATLIYLTAPYTTIYNRITQRGDDKIEPNKVFSILKQYEHILHSLKGSNNQFKFMEFDTSKYHSEDIAESFYYLNFLKELREEQEDLNASKNVFWNSIDRINQFIFKLYAKTLGGRNNGK